jgi:hypothetical protein
MRGGEARLWLLDVALPLGGLVLLVIGANGVPLALVLAFAALGLAFVGWLAEADGLPLPRPGRVPIRRYGCWETPLAFGVRHEGRELVFCREEDEHGAWSSDYTVRERRGPGSELPLLPAAAAGGGWALCGRTPVGLLRFEHRERMSYVTRRSLERALTQAGGLRGQRRLAAGRGRETRLASSRQAPGTPAGTWRKSTSPT